MISSEIQAQMIWEGVEPKEQIEHLIKQVVEVCFQEEKLTKLNFYMSITFTTPQIIKELNTTYRHIEKETDVLSFPMFEKEEIEAIRTQKQKNPIPEVLGDAVINISKVEEQAKEYGHSFERELSYMVVHSFYHLMGYDHMEDEEKKQMRQKEEIVLEKLGQTRS